MIRKLSLTLLLSLGYMIPVLAATISGTYNFTYNFSHTISFKNGYQAATGSKLTVETTTSSWGSNVFYVKVYTLKGTIFKSPVLVGTDTVYGPNYSTYTSSFNVTKGVKYEVEFWKAQDGKYIIGEGKETY